VAYRALRVLSIIDDVLGHVHPARVPKTRPARPTPVRARTRALLLDAAVRVFAQKGAGASAIHEIAAEAGVSNGTFYNYFRTREELLEAASRRLAERLFDEVTARSKGITDAAERVAIGTRRFLAKAREDPTWGAALLRIWASSPVLNVHTSKAVVADLRAGRRRGRLRYESEAAALDLVQGAVLAGIRTVLEGRAGAEHPSHVAALVLRGLSVDPAEADAIARRPLPGGDVTPARTPRAASRG
jgi:AcrR family transcriptional regulator